MKILYSLVVFMLAFTPTFSCNSEEEKTEKPVQPTPPEDPEPDPDPEPTTLTFDDDIKPLLLAMGCTASGCHLNPTGSQPDFEDYLATKENSAKATFKTGHYTKLVDAESLAKIESWIDADHPENKNGNGLNLVCAEGSTYYDDCIKPELLAKKCLACHPGVSLPDLSTHTGAKAVADEEIFTNGHTDDNRAVWTDEEKSQILEWIASGKKKDANDPGN